MPKIMPIISTSSCMKISWITIEFLQQQLHEDGILVIDNFPNAALIAKECGFNGDMMISSSHNLIIAKSKNTSLDDFLKNNDLKYVIEPALFADKKASAHIKILPEREKYKSLLGMYDMCKGYQASRWGRSARNFFQDKKYISTLNQITVNIENILQNKNVNPEDVISTLNVFAKTLEQSKTFPSTWFKSKSQQKNYGFQMNDILKYVSLYTEYVSDNKMNYFPKPESSSSENK